MNLDAETGLELIIKAYKQEKEDKLFQIWNLEHVWMDKDDYISFEDYKAKVLGKVGKSKEISKEEIEKEKQEALAKAEKIKEQLKSNGYVSTT